MPGFSLETALVRNVIYPLWARRDHPAYKRYLADFQRSQFFTKEQLAGLQRDRVRDLLHHSYDHCSFYKQRIDEAGLKPKDFADPACLQALPPLTKTDIQRNMAGLQADSVPENARVRNQTGGSTGAPLQFYVDKERLDSRMASTVRHDAWANYLPGDWFALLWGARLDLSAAPTRWDHFKNRVLYRGIELNTSSISEADWASFISKVRSKRPHVLLAYTQAAVLFAEYARQHALNDISFDTIITTAEMLLPGQRELLESTFKGKVFNRYGCREVSVIASECDQHNGMHVNADALCVEVVPDPAIPAPSGKILITDMLNRSMPLIRYEIEDIGQWSPSQQCECGRTLPLLSSLEGRSTDFLEMPDGRKISGPSLTLVVADVAEVQHVQIVQESASNITLRVVPGVKWDPTVETELRKRMALYLDPRITVAIELCDEMLISASGKHRFVINKMAKAKGQQ